jgi:mono/diheme cytochrome c family protein/multidrug transporter EmrE-like cation transporter
LLAYKEKFAVLKPAVKYSLLLGILAAVASCISGFFLSQSGDYDEALVSKHQWFGIGLAFVSVMTYFFIEKNIRFVKWLMPLIALLIIITGHLGGSLTHGEDYLTKGFSSKGNDGKFVSKPIPNVQQVLAYNDIVQPILEARCYNCHGPNKQKGKLRLDEQAFIEKGGEDGKIIIAGSAGESDLIKRILLPNDNKDHMPPKEKGQLTKEQIELLNWWVNSGADFHKKVAELKQPEKIKPYLAALQSGTDAGQTATSDIPDEKIDKAPDDIIKKLKELNVSVNNVSQGSNYLSVNFVAVDSVSAKHTGLLQQIDKQIAWLKLGNTK